jgi:hypothetical protein
VLSNNYSLLLEYEDWLVKVVDLKEGVTFKKKQDDFNFALEPREGDFSRNKPRILQLHQVWWAFIQVPSYGKCVVFML